MFTFYTTQLRQAYKDSVLLPQQVDAAQLPYD